MPNIELIIRRKLETLLWFTFGCMSMEQPHGCLICYPTNGTGIAGNDMVWVVQSRLCIRYPGPAGLQISRTVLLACILYIITLPVPQ